MYKSALNKDFTVIPRPNSAQSVIPNAPIVLDLPTNSALHVYKETSSLKLRATPLAKTDTSKTLLITYATGVTLNVPRANTNRLSV